MVSFEVSYKWLFVTLIEIKVYYRDYYIFSRKWGRGVAKVWDVGCREGGFVFNLLEARYLFF